MNINDYRNAMDHIAPAHGLKRRIMRQTASQKRYTPVRRVLACGLAAVLMLTCMFTVALAASLELRMAVLSFFHMEEREQVPNETETSGQPGISQTEIGGLHNCKEEIMMKKSMLCLAAAVCTVSLAACSIT